MHEKREGRREGKEIPYIYKYKQISLYKSFLWSFAPFSIRELCHALDVYSCAWENGVVRVPQMMIYDLNISLSEDNFHLTKPTNFVKGFLRFIYHYLCTLMNDIFNQKMTIVRSSWPRVVSANWYQGGVH